MSVLQADSELVNKIGQHNLIRYAQAHGQQLVTVTYPLDEQEMTTLEAKVTRWVTKQAKKEER
jgi:hypothetical protein